MNAEDGVLWVVEIHSKKAGWRPAWNGGGVSTSKEIVDMLMNHNEDLRGKKTRVVKYVRAEG